MESVNENWRPVKGYEGLYEISDLGRIRSFDRIVEQRNGIVKRIRGRAISQTLNTMHGYFYVTLNADGKVKTFSVHRLVARAFIGDWIGGQEVNHIDGVKTNNVATNLEYVTSSENKRHARSIGLWANRGAQHGNTKFGDAEATEAHRMYENGSKLTDIAKRFGVTKTCIGHIVSGKRWSHLGLRPIHKYRRREANAV